MGSRPMRSPWSRYSRALLSTAIVLEGAARDPSLLLTDLCHSSQARGRARAGQSVYSFVATEGSRELQRELTNEALEVLMEQAVAAVQKMDPQEFKAKVSRL